MGEQGRNRGPGREVGEPDVDRFEQLYVRRVGIRKSLKEFANGDCVFFDSQQRNCNVYSARPRQCRTWPFWDSNLKDAAAWAATWKPAPGAGMASCTRWQRLRPNGGRSTFRLAPD